MASLLISRLAVGFLLQDRLRRTADGLLQSRRLLVTPHIPERVGRSTRCQRRHPFDRALRSNSSRDWVLGFLVVMVPLLVVVSLLGLRLAVGNLLVGPLLEPRPVEVRLQVRTLRWTAQELQPRRTQRTLHYSKQD